MDLQMGVVELNVKNLVTMREFYHTVMGLEILDEDASSIVLGLKKNVLLKLHQHSAEEQGSSSEAGLYHFAVLFSSRGDLARTIHRIVKKTPQFFSGTGDHLVSEAFYFSDPEGNGIELYFDRDRTSWQWEQGQVKMASLFIDPKEYVEKYIVLEEQDTEVNMGHVHLKVGDIEKAKEFYVEILGFSITAEMPTALFISVGGYHHHIGLNTWESYGAEERKNSFGLKSFELKLVGSNDLELLKSRLEKHGIAYVEENEEVSFFDPWKNNIVFSSFK